MRVVTHMLDWLEGRRADPPLPPNAIVMNRAAEQESSICMRDDTGVDPPPPSPYDWDSPTAQAVNRLLNL